MAAKRKTKNKKTLKRAKKKLTKKPTKKKARAKKLKSSKRKTASKKQGTPRIPAGQIVGVVTHYFPHVQAAVIKLKKPLSVGDVVHMKGKTTDFDQKIESMQIDHVPIQDAKKGDEIGLRVVDRVREHDLVLLPT